MRMPYTAQPSQEDIDDLIFADEEIHISSR